jgi:hypothetical protein
MEPATPSATIDRRHHPRSLAAEEAIQLMTGLLTAYMHERCTVDPAYDDGKAALYADYDEWCRQTRDRFVQRAFQGFAAGVPVDRDQPAEREWQTCS